MMKVTAMTCLCVEVFDGTETDTIWRTHGRREYMGALFFRIWISKR